MFNNVKLFENVAFGQVRVVLQNGEPWFVAKDVAAALGYVDPADAVQKHCKKVNKISHQGATPNRPPLNILIIPESDIYKLILYSPNPSAEKFLDWICKEVLRQSARLNKIMLCLPILKYKEKKQ